jgi:hypothetical protein
MTLSPVAQLLSRADLGKGVLLTADQSEDLARAYMKNALERIAAGKADGAGYWAGRAYREAGFSMHLRAIEARAR